MGDPIILVTGASGLLGQAFMRRVQDDYDVLGFDVVEAPETRRRRSAISMSRPT